MRRPRDARVARIEATPRRPRLPDRAEVGATGDAVLQEPVGLGLVGAGVDASLGFERWADRAGSRPSGPGIGCRGRPVIAAGLFTARRRTVTWSTLASRLLAAAMPSPMRIRV